MASAMSTREPTQFAFRALKDVGISIAPPLTSDVVLANKPDTEVKALKYSPNGKYLAWAVSEQVCIINAESQAVVSVIEHPSVLDVEFSPRGTYLMTWERYTKSEEITVSHNLKVWESKTGKLKGCFIQKAYTSWALQWTDDEKLCAKLFAGEVRFYSPASLNKPAMTLALDGITAFSVSPGLSPSVAVFVPEIRSKPALVRMYQVGSFSRPVANKTFFKADKIEFYWHKLGTNLLVLTQTEVDKTGRNYYGESSLYFMAAAGNFDCRVVLDREGPIHDVTWSPTEKEFVVSYGFMPAKVAMFNHRAEMSFDFGIAPRNFIRFNPHGRVVAIAGFGNLSGQVDLWDRKTLKKIKTIDAHGSSFCEWGPDGRYLMAATLSPRLRVDNGIRIWHYSGALVYHKEISELYQVDWRPASVAKFPQRSALSPVPDGITITEPEVKAEKKPAGAYRPPHARNRVAGNDSPRSLSDMAESRLSGASTIVGASATQHTVPGAAPRVPPGANPNQINKNAKKSRRNRNKKKSADGEKDSEGSPVPSTAPVGANGGNSPQAPKADPTSEVEMLKKVRGLKKKLGQIETLVKKRDSGEKLEANQLTKIESKGCLEKEVAELNAKLANLRA